MSTSQVRFELNVGSETSTIDSPTIPNETKLKEQQNGLLQLNGDCLFQVMKFVEDVDLQVLARVCHKLRQHAIDMHLWKHILLKRNKARLDNSINLPQRPSREELVTRNILHVPKRAIRNGEYVNNSRGGNVHTNALALNRNLISRKVKKSLLGRPDMTDLTQRNLVPIENGKGKLSPKLTSTALKLKHAFKQDRLKKKLSNRKSLGYLKDKGHLKTHNLVKYNNLNRSHVMTTATTSGSGNNNSVCTLFNAEESNIKKDLIEHHIDNNEKDQVGDYGLNGTSKELKQKKGQDTTTTTTTTTTTSGMLFYPNGTKLLPVQVKLEKKLKGILLDKQINNRSSIEDLIQKDVLISDPREVING